MFIEPIDLAYSFAPAERHVTPLTVGIWSNSYF